MASPLLAVVAAEMVKLVSLAAQAAVVTSRANLAAAELPGKAMPAAQVLPVHLPILVAAAVAVVQPLALPGPMSLEATAAMGAYQR
jgi:hypothetical protein